VGHTQKVCFDYLNRHTDNDEERILIGGWVLDSKNLKRPKIVIKGVEDVNFSFTERARPDVLRIFKLNEGSAVGFEIELKNSLFSSSFKLEVYFADGKKITNLDLENIKQIMRKSETNFLLAKFYLLRRGFHILRTRGLKSAVNTAYRRLFAKRIFYRNWIKKHENWDQQVIDEEIANFSRKPKISIVMPVYNVDKKWFSLAINSIKNQYYSNWELCLADDASTKSHVRPMLEKFAGEDERIKVVFREKNGHISQATNSAIAVATGDFVAFMDNDDEISQVALFEVVKALNKDSEIDFFYSDEDKISEREKRWDVFFKPDWNPELLLGHNYITHFLVVSKKLLDKVGILDSNYDGAQDYDFILRASEKANKIHHIKSVSYHWRTVETSTARNPENKNYAYLAGERAIRTALERRGIKATVSQANFYGGNRVKYDLLVNPRISIIATGAKKFSKEVQKNLGSNSGIPAKNIEFVDGNSFEEIKRQAGGDYLLFLDGEVFSSSNDWLRELSSFLQFEDVGVVTGKLLTEHFKIAEAGIDYSFAREHLEFVEQGSNETDHGYYFWLALPRKIYSATQGFMLTEKTDFDFFVKTTSITFNHLDWGVDFCRWLEDKTGKRNVFTPHASLRLSTIEPTRCAEIIDLSCK